MCYRYVEEQHQTHVAHHGHVEGHVILDPAACWTEEVVESMGHGQAMPQPVKAWNAQNTQIRKSLSFICCTLSVALYLITHLICLNIRSIIVTHHFI